MVTSKTKKNLLEKEPEHLGTKIGKGREAEVFNLNHECVVKLFYKRTEEQIKNEVRINQLIYEAGLPVPAAIKTFETDGRLGIVFERISGKSMLTEMSTKPWKLFRYAKQLAVFHSIMHEKIISGLPKQRLQLIKKIQSVETLNEEIKTLALGILNSLPKGEQLCHGDYHPDNVIMTKIDLKIIDWTTSSAGNPIADVALTSIILQLGELPPGTPLITRWVVTIGRKLFHYNYLSHYFKLNPGHKNEYKKWLLPIAIGRLYESIVEEQDQLLAFIKKRQEENNR